MSKKKDKKINKIGKATKADSISKISGVEKTSGVSKVGKVAKTNNASDIQFSIKDRDKLFKVIEEESENLFKKSNLSKKEKEVIKRAVKMAVDSGLIEEN